jgi:hypothetical protein
MSSVTEVSTSVLGKQGETLSGARECRFVSHPKYSCAGNPSQRGFRHFDSASWMWQPVSRAASGKNSSIVLYPLLPDQIFALRNG